ncbi:MAG: hypothetical protein M3P34_10960, partial [Actinomycetota bacterium]|nr:hypothetical protein [Actinomycetota bacterium]
MAVNSRGVLVRELPRASRPLTAAAAGCVLVSSALPILFAIATGAAVAAVPGAVGAGFDSAGGRRLLAAILVVG